MRLYHVTPRANLGSIGREGIDPRHSRGKRQECWFVGKSKVCWAILHVHKRHGVPVESVAVLEVVYPMAAFVRRGRGAYSCPKVVPALYITDSYSFSDFALPVEESPPTANGMAG